MIRVRMLAVLLLGVVINTASADESYTPPPQNLAARPALAVVPGGFGGTDSNAFLGVSSGGVHYALPILTETVDFSTPIQLVGADDPAVAIAAGNFMGEEDYDIAALTPGGIYLVADRGSPDAGALCGARGSRCGSGRRPGRRSS